MTDDQLQEIIAANGYLDVKKIKDNYAAIVPLLFTWAIIYDFTLYGYNNRWCYKTYEGAKKALDEWSGEGEPIGWFRHPDTGRRFDENGKMYIAR